MAGSPCRSAARSCLTPRRRSRISRPGPIRSPVSIPSVATPCSSGLVGRVWTSVLEPFSGLYPWINVETLELSSSEITERYLAERSSGSRTADFIAHSPDGWLTLQERGEIMPHTSAEVAHFPAGSNPFPGLYTFGCDPLLLVWNKAALPAELAPTSFADMVEKVTSNQDLFRDRITTYNAGTGSYGYGINYAFVQHHGEIGSAHV